MFRSLSKTWGCERCSRLRRMMLKNLLLVPLLLLGILTSSTPSLGADGWQNRPKVCAESLPAAELRACQLWVSNVEQPSPDTTASCCGESDAFLADAFEVDDDGNYVAIITENYQPTYGDDGEGGSYSIPGYAKGTRVVIPKNKINPNSGKKGGNPTGHGIVFMDTHGAVLCYFSPTLS